MGGPPGNPCHSRLVTFYAKSAQASLRYGLRKVFWKSLRCWRLWQVRFSALSREDQACGGGRRVCGRLLGGRYTPRTPGNFELRRQHKAFGPKLFAQGSSGSGTFFPPPCRLARMPYFPGSSCRLCRQTGRSELLPLSRLVHPFQLLAVAAGAAQGLGQTKE